MLPFQAFRPACDSKGGRLLLGGAALRHGAAVLLTVLAAAPAWAQGVEQAPQLSGASQGRAQNRGVSILLERANFWNSVGRPELAQQALDRLISVDPNNADILSVAAETAAQNGDRAAAEVLVARLAQIAPGSPQLATAQAALRATMLDQTILADARQLARGGQREAAVQRYRTLFANGEVPPGLAAEFYLTLAGVSDEHFEEARQGFGRILERSPNNQALQLAYAQILTYNAATRPDGVEQLRKLADSPAIGPAARAAWRQALLWGGPDPDTFKAIEVYLETNPSDAEVLAKLEESRATIIPPWMVENMGAWVAFTSGRIADAERGFTAALALEPNNYEVLSGLATVRQSQGRTAEARSLLERALEAAPDHREELEKRIAEMEAARVTASNFSRRGQGGNFAVPPSRVTLAWQELNRGRLDQATAHARRAAAGRGEERVQGEVVLGLVAMRRQDFAAAEGRFRAALAGNRRFTPAVAGLYEVLQRQKRFAEADQLVAETGYRPSENVQAVRAAVLQEEAQNTRDAESKIALLRGALAADPRNVWAAYDMAQMLKSRGQQEESRRVERDLASRGTPDALFAAALLADVDARPADVVARLNAVPARSRSEDAARLLERSRRVLELRQLERAARGNPRSEAARRMLALAGQPDPTGETQAAVIRAFTRLRQAGNAEAAAQAAGAAVASAPPAARVAIAGALLEAGKENDAAALATSAERDPRLSRDERRLASSVRASSDAAAADRLSRNGDQRAALARLRPALDRASDDPQLQLSLARVYVGTGRATEAQQIAETVLRRDPGNVAAWAVAGEAAVAERDLGRAEEILRQGRASGLDRLQAALLDARIARARGDNNRARSALEEAARLRARQLTSLEVATDAPR